MWPTKLPIQIQKLSSKQNVHRLNTDTQIRNPMTIMCTFKTAIEFFFFKLQEHFLKTIWMQDENFPPNDTKQLLSLTDDYWNKFNKGDDSVFTDAVLDSLEDIRISYHNLSQWKFIIMTRELFTIHARYGADARQVRRPRLEVKPWLGARWWWKMLSYCKLGSTAHSQAFGPIFLNNGRSSTC